MGYPDYPHNRLIVDGVDLTTTYGMILGDGYTMEPPTPKTYSVDIPGWNGKLDLTESLLGDTAYENRKQEFTFYVINAENFEQTKTKVSNFLHGKAFDYQITMDPGYTYHGRFTVTGYEHSAFSDGILGAIKISIDADPYKKKEGGLYRLDAIGGNIYMFESGRKNTRPTFQASDSFKVIFNNKLYKLPKGTWTIHDLLFKEGKNELYVNSHDIRNLSWGNLKSNVTWGVLKTKRLYEWYKSNGTGSLTYKTWQQVSDRKWSDLSISTWNDMIYIVDPSTSVEDVYIEYDWSDL